LAAKEIGVVLKHPIRDMVCNQGSENRISRKGKAMAILLILVGVLFLLWGGFNVLAVIASVFSSGANSAYGTGSLIGQGFVAVLFILIGLKAFKSGRARMAGGKT
jgi:hypothetical protein